MPLFIQYQPYKLQFKFEAGTSRGVLTEKTSWLLKITDNEQPGIVGYGECGPFNGLSIDAIPDFEVKLIEICRIFNSMDLEVFPFNLQIILQQIIPYDYPSIRFGLETALLDFMNGGIKVPYPNTFSQKGTGIPINGLVWMGSEDFMNQQIQEKLTAGFTTVKIKVGAIDFDQECRILETIRNQYSPEQVTLRVDANGAFTPSDVHTKLTTLSTFFIHSIEQPIATNQHEFLKELCATSPIPIALDEELIGKMDYMEKFSLLKNLLPKYIVLKPTLLGGFQQCKEWIEIAQRLSIGWWITSALESNLGLNAIAQFTAQYDNVLPQGLGTGQIYQNNLISPLEIKLGSIYSNSAAQWDISVLDGHWITP